MKRHKILIVEDEQSIIDLVHYNLSKEGYHVLSVMSGEDALETARSDKPDLILLDLMLPGIDGLEVCKILNYDPRTLNIPILILTAKSEESDIITGLELGADDYITKPFSPKILIARIEAVIRRRSENMRGAESAVLRIDKLVIDPNKHKVSVNGEILELIYSEFKLLHLLAQRAGWVFTRSQIVDELRGEDYAVTERSVDV